MLAGMNSDRPSDNNGRDVVGWHQFPSVVCYSGLNRRRMRYGGAVGFDESQRVM